MKFLYYIGCVIPYRAPNYDLSTRVVLEHLKVELVDMPDAGCCGIYVRQVDELKSLVLGARIWAMAEAQELDILSPCPGCVSTLTHVRDRLNQDRDLKGRVNKILKGADREFNGTQQVKHVLKLIEEDIGMDVIREAVVHPLEGVLAAHYGCHLVRPSKELQFDDPEVPVIIDQIIELTGAQSVDYSDKMGCCGMNVHGNKPLRDLMCGQKLLEGDAVDAQAFVVGCPACYLSMGLNQSLASKVWEQSFNMPIILFTQLLGLAFGYPPEKLGFNRNRPKVDLNALGVNGKEIVS